jgi:hypothetical protein
MMSMAQARSLPEALFMIWRTIPSPSHGMALPQALPMALTAKKGDATLLFDNIYPSKE